MKYKLTSKTGQCGYEEYDREYFEKTSEMKACGCETSIKAGNKFVCINHLPAVLLGDSKPEMEDHRPIKKIVSGTISGMKSNEKDIKKGFKIIPFREDFIKIAKGEKVNIRQMSMFDSKENRPDKKEMTEEEKKIRHCDGCTEINPTETRCKICKGADNQPVTINVF